jgi:hypothetical protein
MSSPGWGATSNSVEFEVDVRQPDGSRVATSVRYDCGVTSPTNPALKACFRYEGGAATLVIDGLVNGTATEPVFETQPAPPSPPPQPTYLSIVVRRAAAGSSNEGYDYAIRLEHGVQLRNLSGAL